MAGVLERAFNTRAKEISKAIPLLKPSYPATTGLGFHWTKSFLEFAYDAYESVVDETQAANIIATHYADHVTQLMAVRVINYFKGDIFFDVETLCYHWLTAVLPLTEAVGGTELGTYDRFRGFLAYCLENKYDLRPEPVGVVELKAIEGTFNVIAEVIERDSKNSPAS